MKASITAVAHQSALAIANRNLQIKLASNAEVLERLQTNFSPQVHCDGANAGEVSISPEMNQHVLRIVEGVPVLIATKQEGDLAAYRIVGVRGEPAAP